MQTKVKRTLALVLGIVMILCTLPVFTVAAATDPFFEGSGTKADPYLIQKPEDLANLVYLTNNNYSDKGLYDTKTAFNIPGTTTAWTVHGKSGYYSGRWGGSSLDVQVMRYYKMTADRL